jgi:hypothetical protein
MNDIDRLVTNPENKVSILFDALQYGIPDVRLWAMNNIDSLEIILEKKVDIYLKKLNDYHSDVKIWALRNLQSLPPNTPRFKALTDYEDRQEEQRLKSMIKNKLGDNSPAIGFITKGNIEEAARLLKKDGDFKVEINSSVEHDVEIGTEEGYNLFADSGVGNAPYRVLYPVYGDRTVYQIKILPKDQAMSQTPEKPQTPDAAMLFAKTRIGMMSDVNRVAAFLNDSSRDIRQAAMNRLDILMTDPDKKLPILQKALGYYLRPEVILWAIERLEQLGSRNAVDLISTYLSDGNPTIRKAAKVAVDKLVTEPSQKISYLEANLAKAEQEIFYRNEGWDEIYNEISDELHKLGQSSGDYIYQDRGYREKHEIYIKGSWTGASYGADSPSVWEPSHYETVEGAWKSDYRKVKRDQAMLQTPDKAALAKYGGIDLNQINVKRNGKTVNVQFDPAQLNELMQGGFEGFTPVIINIQHILSPFQLLGINTPKQEVQLAKV